MPRTRTAPHRRWSDPGAKSGTKHTADWQRQLDYLHECLQAGCLNRTAALRQLLPGDTPELRAAFQEWDGYCRSHARWYDNCLVALAQGW